MKKAIAQTAPRPEGSSAERLSQIKEALVKFSKEGGHEAARLVAVSKTYEADAIRPLLDAGQRVFGENRVQEAEAKWPALKAEYSDIALHLVGQLQSNKATEAVALFDVIHSVDRSSLVQALAKALAVTDKKPELLVQVNIGEEEQKGGVAIADLPALLAEAQDAGLTISGLMAVPPLGKDPAPYFALLAKLAKRHSLAKLSMGMSADYDEAARLGASYVRIGSALFGARTYESS